MRRGATEPWRVHFFQRHQDDDPEQRVPGEAFLDDCPPKVEATFYAVLNAVADGPPPSFSGGGKWEAMHGSMAGYFEARTDGPGRTHYRLFCILERSGAELGLGGPSVVVIAGLEKAFRTTFSERDYARIRALGDEYRKRKPRSVAS